MALTDFKLIHSDTTGTTTLDTIKDGVVANTLAKAADVNAIFRQNSLIAVGLLNGLSGLGNNASSLNPNTSSLSQMTDYFSNACLLYYGLNTSTNVLTIGLGANSNNKFTLALNDLIIGKAKTIVNSDGTDKTLGSSNQPIYLSNGVFTQCNALVPQTRTINSKALSGNITLTGGDINVSSSDSTKISAAIDNIWQYFDVMTATGDIIIGGTVSQGYAEPTRLAKGSEGQVLTVGASGLKWAGKAVTYEYSSQTGVLTITEV